ncbi:MAG: hypothetical protein DMD26_17740 [Gemmatimonadetes bacterium]|nr:MAG: hypothetical protein DMD26_17740 [Gemmatimonadota bacterium]
MSPGFPSELVSAKRIVPDDTHETLIHQRWLSVFDRMQTFLQRFLWDKNKNTTVGAGSTRRQ